MNRLKPDLSSICNVIPLFDFEKLLLSFQVFILNEVRRDHATFHEFEVEGTTYDPVGDV